MVRHSMSPSGAWARQNQHLHRYTKTPMEHRERKEQPRKKGATERWMDFLMDSITSPETAVDKRMHAFRPPSAMSTKSRPGSSKLEDILNRPRRPVSAPAEFSDQPVRIRSPTRDTSGPDILVIPAADDLDMDGGGGGGEGGEGAVRAVRPQSATRSRGAERIAGEVTEDPSVLGVLEEGDELVWMASDEVQEESSSRSNIGGGGYVEGGAQTDAIPQLEAIKAVEASARSPRERRSRPRHWTAWEPSTRPGSGMGRGLRPGSAGGGDPGLTARTATWALDNRIQATQNRGQIERIVALEHAKNQAAAAAKDKFFAEKALKESIFESLEARKSEHFRSIRPGSTAGHAAARSPPGGGGGASGIKVGDDGRPATAPASSETWRSGGGSALHGPGGGAEVMTLDDLRPATGTGRVGDDMGAVGSEQVLHPVDEEEKRRLWSPEKSGRLRSEGAAKVKELKWRQDELRHQSEKRRIQRNLAKARQAERDAQRIMEEERQAKEAEEEEERRRQRVNQMFVLAKELEAEEKAKSWAPMDGNNSNNTGGRAAGDGETAIKLKPLRSDAGAKSLSCSLGFSTRSIF